MLVAEVHLDDYILNHYAIYAAAVGGFGLLLIWQLQRSIRRAQTRLTERLEKLKRFDSVRTESPLDDPTGLARERGMESVATRFSMIRRILIPAVAVCIFTALALPLLSGASASMLSLVAAVTAVVAGIAAKPLLENLIAGVVISFSQPIRIGDTVIIDGHYGTIEDITITHTTIKIWDWRRYMVPNHRMIDKDFINLSIIDRFQWAHVEFWVSTEADLDQVQQIAITAAKNAPSFAGFEEPRFWLMETAKEGVRCWVAAWASSPSSAWQFTHEIRTRLMQAFQAAGISTHSYRHELNGFEAGLSLPSRIAN
jgi:small-conductance mechanosensitive channel